MASSLASPLQRAKAFAIDHRLMRVKWLRRLALSGLARFGQRDMEIDHHWVLGHRIRLHRFRHKGYWFYGRRREHNVMLNFARLIRPGDTVFELGSHIGYISTYFAHLAGPTGRAILFEPSPDNLAYLEPNVAGLPGVEIVRRAVSDHAGRARFFIEGLTGQNSTLVDNYSVFSANRDNAFSHEGYRSIEVETVTLDAFIAERGIAPDFIKIDIEGGELAALKGMTDCLARIRPVLMVEVTHQQEKVMRLLRDAGYRAYDSRLHPITPERGHPGPNRFFLPAETSVADCLARRARAI
ncbi:MAG TPA: FkbM family methyltransferase [Sphingomonas sp.]|nr:FkbM family methyltransferase [Sphingomonas sp.]